MPTQCGRVDGRIAAGFGSSIDADGNLVLGDMDAYDGFFSDGVLRTNDNTVTLHDGDKAVLGLLTEFGNANGLGTLIAANGILIEAGKTLVGHGTAIGDLNSSGAIIRGASIGVLSVEGNYDQAVSGVLVVEIGGLDNSDPLNLQFDALHVMGTAALAGTLDVSVVDGFVPSTPLAVFGGDGDSVTVLTADSITGAFDTVGGLDYDNVTETGRRLWIDQTSNAVSLTAFQAAWGDTNLDRQINSTDLFAILAAGKYNHPELGPATWSEGDFTGDALVNSSDLFAMLGAAKFNAGPYTMSTPTAALAAVPEPSSIVFAVIALAGLAAVIRRRYSAPC